jgi:hypothetical protein
VNFAGVTRPPPPLLPRSNPTTTSPSSPVGERCPAGTRFGRLRIMSCTRLWPDKCAIKIAAPGLSHPIVRRSIGANRPTSKRSTSLAVADAKHGGVPCRVKLVSTGCSVARRATRSACGRLRKRGVDRKTAIREGHYHTFGPAFSSGSRSTRRPPSGRTDRCARKAVAGAVDGEIGSMAIPQTENSRGAVEAEGGPRGGA